MVLRRCSEKQKHALLAEHNPLSMHPMDPQMKEPSRSKSETKKQPKEEVFGRTSLRISGQKLRSGPPNPGKQALWHRHATRTSTKKLRSEKKLRADFSLPSKRPFAKCSTSCLHGNRCHVPCRRCFGFFVLEHETGQAKSWPIMRNHGPESVRPDKVQSEKPRNFWIFVLNLTPEMLRNIPKIFEISRALFPGKWPTSENSRGIPTSFHCKMSRQVEEKFHWIFLESRQGDEVPENAWKCWKVPDSAWKSLLGLPDSAWNCLSLLEIACFCLMPKKLNHRVHAEGVVLCERTCFCLPSPF